MVSGWRQAIKSKTWTRQDTMSAGSLYHLSNLLRRHFPTLRTVPGFHFLYCNPSNTFLAQDGYDNYQAPCDEAGNLLFARRMWARGELNQHKCPSIGEPIECKEQIKSVRSVGKSVFVEIERQLPSNQSPMGQELRSFVYTNDKYRRSDSEEVVPNHEKTITINITANDIARYSALTYNLHKIHLERAYAISEGFENLVVQGPYMVTLAMCWMEVNGVKVKRFQYKNLRACYEGDITIGLSGNKVDIYTKSSHFFTGTVNSYNSISHRI